jgi:hypothetical protein
MLHLMYGEPNIEPFTRRLAPLTFLFRVQAFRGPLRGELPHVQIFMNVGPNPLTWDAHLLSYRFNRNSAVFKVSSWIRLIISRMVTVLGHGYNAVTEDSCAGSHFVPSYRHSLSTKKVKNVENVKHFRAIHTLRSLTDEEMCAKFGSHRFRNVNLYKVQTNKQRNSQLCI